MTLSAFKSAPLLLTAAILLAGCSGNRSAEYQPPSQTPGAMVTGGDNKRVNNGSLFDVFRKKDTGIRVNRHLWNASLEVLNFLPVGTADPFTGVISTGYGVPPGGGQAYRATVLIGDPALDARSLNVALQTRNGRPVSAETQRLVEDAILTRARQLRAQAGRY